MVYADWLIQSGLASQVRFHGKVSSSPILTPYLDSDNPYSTQRFAWFVSDVTRKDFSWLINSMCYGHLFPDNSEEEMASLRILGNRWKDYVSDGIWVYEEVSSWLFLVG